MSAALRCEGLGFVRRSRTILQGIDARFEAGQVSLLAGATGSGKSTLLHLLGGLLRPTEGTVYAGDDPISRWIPAWRDRWRRDVGIALQSPHLLPGLSALENVIVPLVPRGRPIAELRTSGLSALEAVGAAALAPEPAGALSGGERQRVALARALVGRPGFLLVDEPTAHQDAAGAERIAGVLSEAAARGAVVVVSAHDPRLLEAGLAGRRFDMRDGTLCSTP
jgi:putative ABC transport system ATP-binding protein